MLLTVVLLAILGTALGLIVRSTVPAVAIAVAWMMPLEHISPRGLGRRRALVSRAAAERDHAQRH